MRTLGEYQGKQALFYKQSPETLESLKQVAVIESSESSNRLVSQHQRSASRLWSLKTQRQRIAPSKRSLATAMLCL
jgi:hypothetical protein